MPFAGGRAALGESEADRRAVTAAIDGYCQKAWSKIDSHWHKAEVVILTGGGASIRRVRDYFHEKLTRRGVANVVDFVGDDQAEDGGSYTDGLYKWQHTAEGLGRLATGLGGASIGYGFDPDELAQHHIPRGAKL